MRDVLQGLASRHEWAGWKFEQIKIPHVKHVVQGDNKGLNHHVSFAVPMIQLQRVKLDYYNALNMLVFLPIEKLMDSIE